MNLLLLFFSRLTCWFQFSSFACFPSKKYDQGIAAKCLFWHSFGTDKIKRSKFLDRPPSVWPTSTWVTQAFVLRPAERYLPRRLLGLLWSHPRVGPGHNTSPGRHVPRRIVTRCLVLSTWRSNESFSKELLSKGYPRYPSEKAYFGSSYLQSHSSGLHPQFMTVFVVWNINQELYQSLKYRSSYVWWYRSA